MHLKGAHNFNAPIDQVWNMLMDKDILAKITPGVSRLELISEDVYKAIAEVKMGPVNGSFSGDLMVADKNPPEVFILKIKQNSKIGNVAADVQIQLVAPSAEETKLTFNGKARLSGLLARTGQRVLSGVANALSKQFFRALEEELKQNGLPKA